MAAAQTSHPIRARYRSQVIGIAKRGLVATRVLTTPAEISLNAAT